MKNTLWLFSFICMSFFAIHAQTGPGGVGNDSNNGLWLRTDVINQANGTAITTWNDNSGNGNSANQTAVEKQPVFYTSSALNNMPIIRFDGANDEMSIADADILDNTAGISMYAVLRPNNLNGQPRGILGKRITYSTSENYSYTWFFYSTDKLYLDVVTSNNRFDSNNTKFFNATNYILSWNFDGTLEQSQRSNMVNGSDVMVTHSENSTFIPNGNQPVTLGALNQGYGTYLGADYAEIIQFNEKLNAAEQIIVQNYLSAKYDIALSTNDYYMQDTVANGNFDFNVAGIGQAADGTNHTDSRGSGIVRISSPSALSNQDFLFWGEDRNDASYNFTTNNSVFTEQLDSKWRVSKVNDLGNVTVIFDITNVDLSNKQNCQPLQLVVANNVNFTSSTVYNLTITGNTATANNVTFSDGDFFTLQYLDEIVWDGTSFYNGSGVANAPNATDECLRFTIKAGTTVTLNENAHIRQIDVENGASLNVADGILLEVENELNIDGEVDLIGEAQLIQNHSGTNLNTGQGALKKRQQGTSNLYNYNYWSSPVNREGYWQLSFLEDADGVVNFTNANNANPTTSPVTLSDRWLYQYNSSSGYNGWSLINPTTELLPGLGYTMKGSGGGGANYEYLFKGLPNDGDLSITANTGNDILIGNPYPSALDADVFINDNLSVIDGSLYFWEHFDSNTSHSLSNYEGGYAVYNLMMSLPAISDSSGLTSGQGNTSKPAPTKNVAVGQGFFVSIDNTGAINFNNAQRVFARESQNESVYYRSSQSNTIVADDRMKLKIAFKDPGNYVRIIGLGYDENATNGYDKGFDARAFDVQKNEMYWDLDDEKLSILALSQYNPSQELPVWLKVEDVGNYKFKVDELQNVPNEFSVFLKDNETSTLYDITNNEVSLWLDSMENSERFSIVFQETVLNIEDFNLNNISLIYDAVQKEVKLLDIEHSGITKMTLYSVFGQQIWTKIDNEITTEFNVSDLTDGVYLLKLENNEGAKSFKFVKN